jgi:large subunit ribosomal protein L32
MGAQPKRKISKGRRNRRRAHDSLSMPAIATCPKCAKSRRPHFLCSYCGHYGQKPVTKAKVQERKTDEKKK